MRDKRRAARLLAVLLLPALLSQAGGATAQSGNDFVAGEILIKFKSGHEGPGAKAVEEIGGRLIERLSRIDVSRVELPGGLTVKQALAQLSRLPIVEYAEPNFIVRPAGSAPSDPRWKDQWGMRTVRVPEGWSLTTGSRNVIIAIIDTGVDLTHPDLKQRLVSGYDFLDGNNRPDDVGGHGTHCAGIAAATANNNIGIAGVCPNCAIMPVRVMGPHGGSSADVAKGIIWAADNGARVLSLSLGGNWPSTAQEEALAYAASKGALAVCAAGNQGVDSPFYPARHEQCLAVAASTQQDRRASFSNHGSWVQVAAPGTMILSTAPGGRFEYKEGTSMAAPFVAGLAGLLFSRPGATAASVRRAIENSAVPVGNWVARGRIDARRAIEVHDAATGHGGGSPPTGGGQGAAVPTDALAPASHVMVHGKVLKAPAGALAGSDGSLLVMRSAESGKRRTLAVDITARLPVAGSLSALRVEIEGRFYDNPNTVQARVYDWKAGQWATLGQGTLNITDTQLSFTAKNPAALVSPTGEIKIRLERTNDWWATFDMGLDLVRFHPTVGKVEIPDQTTPSPTPDPPPPDQGESLIDKALDKWNKWLGQ